jgi:hypothetical protein
MPRAATPYPSAADSGNLRRLVYEQHEKLLADQRFEFRKRQRRQFRQGQRLSVGARSPDAADGVEPMFVDAAARIRT